MANVRDRILSRYRLDIDEMNPNLLKLYHIDSADLSPAELEKKFAERHAAWTKGLNNPKEDLKAKSERNLKQEAVYQEILRDPGLRKELVSYFAGKDREKESGKTDAARSFFTLVAMTKKIRREDVDFYFRYFKEESANAKAIRQMLEKEFKVTAPGGRNREDEPDGEEEGKGQKQKKKSAVIVGAFSEKTVLDVHRCEGYLAQAAADPVLVREYPGLSGSLYRFLGLGADTDLPTFKKSVSENRSRVFDRKQEHGTQTRYDPLINLYNRLQSLCGEKDVEDNFEEFKLLVQYPLLTPYMYEFSDVNEKTLKPFYDQVAAGAGFYSYDDFVATYFVPMYDNFHLLETGAKKIAAAARRKASKNAVVKKLDRHLGEDVSRIPLAARILHGLVYWPVYLLYLVFEVFRFVFTHVRHLANPVFVVCLVGENFLFPRLLGIDSLFGILKLIPNARRFGDWLMEGEMNHSVFGMILLCLMVLVCFAVTYAAPPVFVASLMWNGADDLNKLYDWNGLQRTFDRIRETSWDNTRESLRKRHGKHYAAAFFKALMNLVCTAVLCLLLFLGSIFVPMGLDALRDRGQRAQDASRETVSAAETEEETEEETLPPVIYSYYVVTAEHANIRSGPGTDADIVSGADQGAVLTGTGESQTGNTGKLWYEVFLDETLTETGWINESVASPTDGPGEE